MSILVGIQARSTSTRLPNKGFAMIGNMSLTEHIVAAAKGSANHCMTRGDHRVDVDVALLIPTGDELKIYSSIVDIVEGDELDVLSRYAAAFAKYKPEYIVRLTADCPVIQPFMITKIIDTARSKRADYVSNCGEEWRTACDGHDVEIISARLFLWLIENAKEKYDREHVTPLLRRCPPKWATCGAVIMQTDLSDMKLSVDTPEDLDRVREYHARITTKVRAAKMRNNFVVFL